MLLKSGVYIKACCNEGLSIKNIHDEISVVYGDKQMSFSTVSYGQLSKNDLRIIADIF